MRPSGVPSLALYLTSGRKQCTDAAVLFNDSLLASHHDP